MSPQSPTQVTVFAYHMGFGDCFLVRFHYSGFDRHVLIDFGSYPKPDWAGEDFLCKTAESIRQRCNGKLDAIVLTHRHADHISGFATTGDNPGAVIASCNPDVVVQPWTEDPMAERDATGPAAFTGMLDNMHRLADAVRSEANLFAATNPALARELGFLGERNLKNLSAVKNLIDMGSKPGGQSKYVYYGSESGLEQIIPGVQTKVLGPPSLKQSKSIRHQAKKDPDEFWHQLALAAEHRDTDHGPLFPTNKWIPAEQVPPHARWLIERLRSLRGRDLFQIVRSLDEAMNNTSVILLFKVGEKKLLFPGDAQIENWRYAFSHPEVLEELKGVNLYKVGHHGSLNATPKTLWKGFANASTDETSAQRLITILSTESDVHGDVNKDTEVPRQTLVQELQTKSRMVTTETLAKTAGTYAEISMDV